MQTNLLIACWPALTRTGILLEDTTYYLKKQIEHLTRYKHNLSQITFVVAECDQETSDYTNFLNNLPDRIQKASVKVHRKPNYGWSYGSYSEAYGIYRNQFDYYILLEDDYVVCTDHFDDEMIHMMMRYPNCGYLCSVKYMACDWWASSISNGIVSEPALNAIWNKFGCIPHGSVKHGTTNGYGKICLENGLQIHHQADFARSFTEVGYALEDMTENYVFPFHTVVDCQQIWFSVRNQSMMDFKYIIVPVQFTEAAHKRKIVISESTIPLSPTKPVLKLL
jgi:hypothetical protein